MNVKKGGSDIGLGAKAHHLRTVALKNDEYTDGNFGTDLPEHMGVEPRKAATVIVTTV
jgi:hypothetical protein